MDVEFEIRTLEQDLEGTLEKIAVIEDQAEGLPDLKEQREQVSEELVDARNRIDDIEDNAIQQFNEHMETVLDLLEYDNLDRIWIEKKTSSGGRGRSDSLTFQLNIVRTTDSGMAYDDTISNLSESEREVTGLVFALAGYLVHDLHEECPFMLLDSLEAIDADRIAKLVDYFADYPDYLVVALLPEDAQALSDDYHRVREI